MKIFVAFLIIIASVTASAEDPEEWEVKHGEDIIAIRDDCLNKNLLTLDQFKSMQQFKLVNEEPVRKYLLCVAENLGIFQDGKLNDKHIIQQYRMELDLKDVTIMVEQCVEKVKPSIESKTAADIIVYDFYVCLFDTEIGQTIEMAAKKISFQISEDESSESTTTTMSALN